LFCAICKLMMLPNSFADVSLPDRPKALVSSMLVVVAINPRIV